MQWTRRTRNWPKPSGTRATPSRGNAPLVITDEPDSISHNKFAAFSRTGGAVNRGLPGTGNLRADGASDSAYSAGVIGSGRPDHLPAVPRLFRRLVQRAPRGPGQLPPLATATHLRSGDRVLLPRTDRRPTPCPRRLRSVQLHQPADHRAGDGPLLLAQAGTQHLARRGYRRVLPFGFSPGRTR